MSAIVVFPVLLSVVLLVAGVAKVGRPEDAAAAFDSLSLPPWLRRPWLLAVHPWAEIFLGLALLLGAGWPVQAAAIGSLVLTAAYLALIIAAVRRGDQVDCDCFGALAAGRVTARTVWRNVWLVTLAALSIVVTWSNPSVAAQIAADTREAAALAAAGLGAALTVWLVLDTRPSAERSSPSIDSQTNSRSPGWQGTGDLDDYERFRTPAVPVTRADGTRLTLRQLSSERAQLILAVSPGCSGCIETMEQVPSWRLALPALDIRLMVAATPAASPLTSTAEPQTVHDEQRWIMETFGLTGTPAAMLLGADGYMAGGPVHGGASILAFVEDIQAELNATGTSLDPVAPV